MLAKQVESLSKHYYKVRWNDYKLRQLSIFQISMDSYYKLRQLFYYKVRHGLLQIATGITKCDKFITNCDSTTRPHSQWSKGGAVVRALASHQCGPGSNPGVDAIYGLSLLLVPSIALRSFSAGTPVFPFP